MNSGKVLSSAAAAAGSVAMSSVGFGQVLGVEWRTNSLTSFDLFAEVAPGTTVLNADVGDETIDMPPGGVNHGLFSSGGDILPTSGVALGQFGSGEVAFAREASITEVGDGSLFDASWFVVGGVAGEQVDVDSGSILGVMLGTFDVEPGATLGGLGGLDGSLQSRIFFTWTSDQGTGSGVFDIAQVPAPGSAALLALAGLTMARRRRR